MLNKFRVYGLTCALFLVASFAANATTIVLPTDEQLVAKSAVIVDGTVVSSEAVDRDGRIVTETVVEVARNIKGETSQRITVREAGGILDGRITKIYGTPEFKAGERVLLFLEQHPRGGYRTVDMFVGKFSEAKSGDGRRLWLRQDAAQDVTLLDADFAPIHARNVQRDAAGFESFVHDRIAGRPGRKSYGVENPVLARETAGETTKGRITADFTLISEPTIYRWFRFDSNQSAAWYSSGTQPGYTNGGVSELQTAMTTWTSYGSAKILYQYAGNRSGTMGGLNSPNSVNEILFNDPLNEISGSWNPSTGGVVGTGGFNGVTSQQNWTAPFTADATHPAGATRAWNIVEGNLVIQDAVSQANGISSKILAEIIAHEIGHTLGFGHSAESNALMYASITGLGSSLRADDQTAARWLYPNGGTTNPGPAVPASPSNLVALASGSNIDLEWRDNATNETSQSVFISSGGNFTKAGDVNANVTSARLTGVGVGSYSVYVVANNGNGSSAPSNTATVAITPAAPAAAFTVAPPAGTVGTTFLFTSTSSGTIESIAWDFGDGETATGTAASHIYTRSGTFTVTLTVKGAGRTSYATQPVMVSGPLTSSFTYTPANPTTNDTVYFNDQSGGGPQAWLWTFGDGTTSNEQNPSKHYQNAGFYPVTLTIYRNGEQAVGQRVVTVINGAPSTPVVNAAFSMSTSLAAVNADVQFSDQSTGGATSWAWTFGDGKSSNARNPVHAYTNPGVYNVTLVAGNGSTSGTATRQITITQADDAYRSLVSVATQTAGANNTSWRTELNVFNAGTQGATTTFVFLPSANGSVVTRTIFFGAKQSMTFANALIELFGIESGAGALLIEATSAGHDADLRVTSRTFTTGTTGTYGQSVPNVDPVDLEQLLYITGIAANDAFRSNIGIVNRGGTPLVASLTLYNRNGGAIATKAATLAANSFQQAPLASFFPALGNASHDALTLVITAGAQDVVSAYASVVDNRTQDPVYIQAVPAQKAGSLVVPVVGRAPGANGTFWRSDVTLFNPTQNTMAITLRYGGASRTITLAGQRTMVLADVLSQFGLDAGSGTLQVSWLSAAGPVVTSRTYTTVENGGTFGQSIEPVASFLPKMYVPGLRNDTDFRSNAGFVNGGSDQESIQVVLLSPSGTELARNTISLAPNQQQQYSLTALFPGVVIPAGVTLVAEGDADARIFAYGSMVDNRSGDPVFFAGS